MPRQIDIIRDHIEDALAKGGRAVLGGADAVQPPYVAPTVLVDVPDDSTGDPRGDVRADPDHHQGRRRRRGGATGQRQRRTASAARSSARRTRSGSPGGCAPAWSRSTRRSPSSAWATCRSAASATPASAASTARTGCASSPGPRRSPYAGPRRMLPAMTFERTPAQVGQDRQGGQAAVRPRAVASGRAATVRHVVDHPAVEVDGLHVSYGSTPVLVGRRAARPGRRRRLRDRRERHRQVDPAALREQPAAARPGQHPGLRRRRPAPPRSSGGRWSPPSSRPPGTPGLTAREHAELVCRAHGQDPERGRHRRGARAARAWPGTPTRSRRRSPPARSSGSPWRCALLRPSSLLILDEPEQRLDPEGRATVAAMLGRLRGQRRLAADGQPRRRLRRRLGRGGHHDGIADGRHTMTTIQPTDVAALRRWIRRRPVGAPGPRRHRRQHLLRRAVRRDRRRHAAQATRRGLLADRVRTPPSWPASPWC